MYYRNNNKTLTAMFRVVRQEIRSSLVSPFELRVELFVLPINYTVVKRKIQIEISSVLTPPRTAANFHNNFLKWSANIMYRQN